jgi:hypothetical protein
MPRHSPHTISYKDLISLAEEVKEDASKRLAGARRNGITYLDPLIAREARADKLLRMLRKGLPGKQTDMTALFEQTR